MVATEQTGPFEPAAIDALPATVAVVPLGADGWYLVEVDDRPESDFDDWYLSRDDTGAISSMYVGRRSAADFPAVSPVVARHHHSSSPGTREARSTPAGSGRARAALARGKQHRQVDPDGSGAALLERARAVVAPLLGTGASNICASLAGSGRPRRGGAGCGRWGGSRGPVTGDR